MVSQVCPGEDSTSQNLNIFFKGINAITFGAYGCVLRELAEQDSISSISLAGASAGLIQVGLSRVSQHNDEDTGDIEDTEDTENTED